MVLSDWSPPMGFGLHPNFLEDAEKRLWSGDRTTLGKLRNPLHPEVTIIPRNRLLHVVDDQGDPIGFEEISLPFSSTDFYAALYEGLNTVFPELILTDPFFRLGNINQLGYLVPARPEHWDPNQRIAYMTPTFPHSRWRHSLLVAILMDVTLARNGFSLAERNPRVLTAGCHDIAMVAGGDAVKAMDPENLNEEKNFSWVLKRFGLAERWKQLFGFNLEVAQQWVMNKGVIGLLLDALDKISYVALDCYHVGNQRPGKIRDFCLAHPLVIDVWQDIRFTADRTAFAFVSPERLYDFLILRALEHTEFLLNPDSRKLDLFLTHLLRPFYKRGEITKEQLLLENNNWLERKLEISFPDKIRWYIEPDLLGWKWFQTEKEQELFCKEIGEDRVERREKSKPFNPGLYLPVFADDGSILPLREVLKPNKVERLERLARQRAGYYVFYYL